MDGFKSHRSHHRKRRRALVEAMGIGLLERGFSVAAVDRDANGLCALREQVGAGPKLEGFVADLTDFDGRKNWLQKWSSGSAGSISSSTTPVSGRDR